MATGNLLTGYQDLVIVGMGFLDMGRGNRESASGNRKTVFCTNKCPNQHSNIYQNYFKNDSQMILKWPLI